MNEQIPILSEILDNLTFIFDNPEVTYSLIPIKSHKNPIYELTLTNQTKNTSEVYIIKRLQIESANIEYNSIKLLKKQNMNVPSVLLYKNPFIIQEKIIGTDLCDYINENLIGKKDLSEVPNEIKDNLYNAIKLLAKWLAKFHKNNIIPKDDEGKIIVLNKGDARLKNFIINTSNDKLYGIDFEESHEGNYIEDISWVCCSLIDTNPGIFEMEEPLHKIELLNLFLREYFTLNHDFKFSFSDFTRSLIENLNKVIIRRELNFGLLNKNTFLSKIIKEID
ncbi:MAG: hypothetical protein KGD63_11100 [Candidatus Lokiarchaeota archaeon]|nr:hypothetical protein [Candidatus Lokiarchaeota archaeon]